MKETGPGYRIVETNKMVYGMSIEMETRFKWRAKRRARDLNARRRVPFYRYDVVPMGNRYCVVPMQNVAEPI